MARHGPITRLLVGLTALAMGMLALSIHLGHLGQRPSQQFPLRPVPMDIVESVNRDHQRLNRLAIQHQSEEERGQYQRFRLAWEGLGAIEGSVAKAKGAAQARQAGVDALHQQDGEAGSRVVGTGTEEGPALEEGLDQMMQVLASLQQSVEREARDLLRVAGRERYRVLMTGLAYRAIKDLRADLQREEMAGFLLTVVQPTGLLGDGGELHSRAATTARVLYLYRLLQLVQLLWPDVGLDPQDQIVYLHWKVEMATPASLASRLEALDQLQGLDPTYPATKARQRLQP